MSYSTSIPPMKVTAGVGGAPNLWIYKSTDDDGTVNGAGYFTNGASLGMKLNDIVLVIDTTTPLVSLCSVSAVNATTGAATTKFGAVS